MDIQQQVQNCLELVENTLPLMSKDDLEHLNDLLTKVIEFLERAES